MRTRLGHALSARLVAAAVSAGAVLASGSAARGQSLNVDFGLPANKPADTYRAAGLPGVWNSIEGQASTTYHLVGLDGRPTAVTLTQSGASTLLSASDPSVTGDDAALLNDALITYDATAETCLFVNGLEPGSYEVLMYAWMPNAPSVRSRVRHDLATLTEDVGGAWTGVHVEGVTYARHVLEIGADGFMGSHSGIVPGALASRGAALSGFQIRKLVPGGPDAGSMPSPDAGVDAGAAPQRDASGTRAGADAGGGAAGGGGGGSCGVARSTRGTAGFWLAGLLVAAAHRARRRRSARAKRIASAHGSAERSRPRPASA